MYETMRKIPFLLALLLLGVACNKDDDDTVDTNLSFDGGEIASDVTASFYETDLGYEIEMDVFPFFELKLEGLDVGRYDFGRGKKNIMIWSTHHYSAFNLENSGFLDISESGPDGVTGNFEIYCESDIDNEIDTVRGEFTDVPITEIYQRSIGQGCGFINDVELSSSLAEYREMGFVGVAWRLFRPDNEWIALDIDKNAIAPGTIVLDTATKDQGFVAYAFSDALYTSELGRAEIEFTKVDESERAIECVVNAALGSPTKTDSLFIRDYKMKLFY
jgi:hypothetical protein